MRSTCALIEEHALKSVLTDVNHEPVVEVQAYAVPPATADAARITERGISIPAVPLWTAILTTADTTVIARGVPSVAGISVICIAIIDTHIA